MPIAPSNKDQKQATDSQPDETQANTQPVKTDLVMASFNEELRLFLMSLIPEAGDRVVFHDIGGNEHTAPAVLAGRRQFLLATEIEKISGSMLAKLRGLATVERGEGALSLGLVAVKIFTDPEIAGALSRAFAIIHPKAVDNALRNGVVADMEEGDPRPPGPFEVFSAEEVVRAVVPFCLAPLKGVVETAMEAISKMG